MVDPPVVGAGVELLGGGGIATVCGAGVEDVGGAGGDDDGTAELDSVAGKFSVDL